MAAEEFKVTEALLTDFVNMAEAENYRCCAPFAGAAHVLSIGAQELFPCRHRLCGPCFRIASLGGANQFRCPEPQCRQQVRTAVPVAERSVPELARLRVRCPIDGCRWEGPYGSLGSEFTSHKRRCQRAWTCPECRNWMPSSRQRSHGATCPDQLIQCGYIGCQVQTRRGESDHHNKICDLRPATCEFAVVGCTAMLNHRELTEHMAAPEVQARHSDLLRRATEIAQRVAVVAQPVAEEQLPRFQGDPIEYKGHLREVSSVVVSADGARLFSADWGGTIREWNTVTNRQIGVFGNRGCKVEIHCLALTTNGRLLFSGDSEGNITQWLVAEAQSTRVRTFSPREQLQSVRTLCLSVDEQSLFSSSNDNTICQWSVTTGVLMHKIVIGVRVYVLRAAMNAHSLFAASDTGISQWSTLTWHRLHTSPQERRVRSMIVSEDGRFLLAGLFDDAHFTIHQWSLETLQEVRVFEGHTSGVVCLAVSTTRPWLFSGSDDNTIRLWSLLTGRCLHIFNGHTAGVKSIAVSRNGRWLYSGSENGVVRKWPLGVDA